MPHMAAQNGSYACYQVAQLRVCGVLRSIKWQSTQHVCIRLFKGWHCKANQQWWGYFTQLYLVGGIFGLHGVLTGTNDAMQRVSLWSTQAMAAGLQFQAALLANVALIAQTGTLRSKACRFSSIQWKSPKTCTFCDLLQILANSANSPNCLQILHENLQILQVLCIANKLCIQLYINIIATCQICWQPSTLFVGNGLY